MLISCTCFCCHDLKIILNAQSIINYIACICWIILQIVALLTPLICQNSNRMSASRKQMKRNKLNKFISRNANKIPKQRTEETRRKRRRKKRYFIDFLSLLCFDWENEERIWNYNQIIHGYIRLNRLFLHLISLFSIRHFHADTATHIYIGKDRREKRSIDRKRNNNTCNGEQNRTFLWYNNVVWHVACIDRQTRARTAHCNRNMCAHVLCSNSR